MDSLLPLVAAVIASMVAGGGVAVVLHLWFQRPNPDAPDLEELAHAVESLQRSVRRLTMRKVRASAGDLDEGDQPISPPAATGVPPSAKADLRSRVFSQLRAMKEGTKQ